jgi:hypothetical protein
MVCAPYFRGENFASESRMLTWPKVNLITGFESAGGHNSKLKCGHNDGLTGLYGYAPSLLGLQVGASSPENGLPTIVTASKTA